MPDNIPMYASCLLVDKEKPNYVLLIRKNRPSWQDGKLNIIGGHIEQGESPSHAVIREVYEECGIKLTDPRYFCTLFTETPGKAIVFFFVDFINIDDAFSKTDEPIEVFDTEYYEFSYEDCIPNLKYLIPLALDPDHPTAVINETK